MTLGKFGILFNKNGKQSAEMVVFLPRAELSDKIIILTNACFVPGADSAQPVPFLAKCRLGIFIVFGCFLGNASSNSGIDASVPKFVRHFEGLLNLLEVICARIIKVLHI